MKWTKVILQEIYGLFVDDIGFAIAIVLWLAAWFDLRRLIVAWPSWVPAVGLFAGVAVILLQSTLRFARTHRSR
jgi:hypothetical protein